MRYFNKKANKEIKDLIVSTCEKIDVLPGSCRMNFMCHTNTVHEAIEAGENRIAMVIHINHIGPIIHFLNVSEEGEFFDNTLGHWTSQYSFYLVKYIKEDEFFQVDGIFFKYRRHLQKQLSFWVRLFNTLKF